MSETAERKFLYRAIPMDWCGACIMLLYKGKGDKCDCGNPTGMSLLGVVGMLYGEC